MAGRFEIFRTEESGLFKMIQKSLADISNRSRIDRLRQAYSNSGGHRISGKSMELAFHPIIINYLYAYTAGASLLRPMVRKNREISWKQSSKTLSTVLKPSKLFDCQAR